MPNVLEGKFFPGQPEHAHVINEFTGQWTWARYHPDDEVPDRATWLESNIRRLETYIGRLNDPIGLSERTAQKEIHRLEAELEKEKSDTVSIGRKADGREYYMEKRLLREIEKEKNDE